MLSDQRRRFAMESNFADADARVARMRALLDDNAWVQKDSGAGGSAVFIGADNWIKVEAPIDAPLHVLRDILDTHLAERQAQWHELLIEGRVLQRYDDRHALCWFAYRSPRPMWNRDTLYVMRRDDVGADEMFIACWTVVDDEAMPPLPEKHYVRIDFDCLFHVRRADGGATVRYRYLQRSDPKVAFVPDSMLLSSQCGILLREVEGLRSACRVPMPPE